MDIGTVLQDALKISWRQRRLWLIAILPVLAAFVVLAPSLIALIASSSSAQARSLSAESSTLSGVVACGVVAGYTALIMAFLTVQGGLIQAVEQLSTTGAFTVVDALRVGASKAPALLVSGIIAYLPIIAVFVVGFAVVSFGDSSSILENSNAMVCAVLPMYCLSGLYAIAATLVFIYAEREVVLNRATPINALLRGWRVLEANLGNSIVLGLIIVAVQFLFSMVTSIIMQVSILPLSISMSRGNLDSVSESLASNGLALVLMIAVFGVLSIVFVVYNAWYTTFQAAAWTLAFRRGKQPPMAALQA